MNLRLFVALPLIVALPISCAKSPPPTAKPQKEINFFDGPQPLAVLIQTDPWSMVIGSDTPLIAIYDDGQVIYLRKEDQQPSVYMHKQLGSQELSEVKQKITSLADFPDSLDYYDLAPGVTDLPESKFYVDLGEEVLATTVYGLKVSRTPLPAYTVFGGARTGSTAPAAKGTP